MDVLSKMVAEASRLQSAAAMPHLTAEQLRAIMLESADVLVASAAYAEGPWRTMNMAIDELKKYRKAGT